MWRLQAKFLPGIPCSDVWVLSYTSKLNCIVSGYYKYFLEGVYTSERPDFVRELEWCPRQDLNLYDVTH
jgi:hypothetical protein